MNNHGVHPRDAPAPPLVAARTPGAAGSAVCRDAAVERTAACPAPPARRFTVDDFEVGRRPIGQGKFGTVFRVRERASRRILVLKVINKRAILDEDVKPQLQREVEVHTRLVHPNIVRMFAYFTDLEQAYLLLEWANSGSLYEKLQAAPEKRCVPARSGARVVSTAGRP